MIRLYDRQKIRQEMQQGTLLFTNRALAALLVPIIIEQFLNSFMGMVDTMMVSNVGSYAITAVSLVDSINNLIIQIFSAMATGASIICSQYLGAKDKEGSNQAARQVVLTVFVISMSIMTLGLIFRKGLLAFIFGSVEDIVMENCLVYFVLTALSYPFLALFNVGAAFFRAGGNSKYPMVISLISNGINIVGNSILIFGLGMGVFGAAVATLVSRMFCMIVIFIALARPRQAIVVDHYLSIRPQPELIKKVLSIGIPSGIENGMFQFGKLSIQSTISVLPTTALAAQAMTNVLENVNGVVGISIGIGLMTVVGQCIGAGKREQAKYYVVKITGIAWIGIIVSCLLVMAIVSPVTRIAGMEPESAALCIHMVAAITVVKPIAWTLSFVPAYGMRAAGDVKFSMITSMITMWTVRVALCICLVKVFGFGTMAVWYGMFADWTVRSIVFSCRFLSGRWLKTSLVEKA